jgi:hypothetical protein
MKQLLDGPFFIKNKQFGEVTGKQPNIIIIEVL